MSWFQKLVDTYDRCSDMAGLPFQQTYERKGDIITKETILLPSNHMMKNTDICITIDEDGRFRRAEERKMSIMIPCTEKSAGRSGGAISPHPLHEEMGYLTLEKKKRENYLWQLDMWRKNNPKIDAVYKYVLGDTLKENLSTLKIKADDSKAFIRFAVEIEGDYTPNLWEDESIIGVWQEFYAKNRVEEKKMCYVTGEKQPIRLSHPKGINPFANGAKLISCNDKNNYTFRGRFTKQEQANSISESASHKGHAMLRFLIETQGYKCDTQAIVAWAVDDGKEALSLFDDSKKISNRLDIYDNDNMTMNSSTLQGEIDMNYAHYLRDILIGKKWNKHNDYSSKRQVAIMAVDAPTTGRMAVLFYRDMQENEYLERLLSWHESCCWWFSERGTHFVSAPSTDRIIEAVYGERKGSSDKGHDKIKKQSRLRLLNVILSGERISQAWITAAVNRVSNPFSYTKADSSWDRYKWENTVSVTCSIVRKYLLDKKEVTELELEKTYNGRDYLYGRLLALADKIESHARYLQDKNDSGKRPTNALRYMTAFAMKPYRTWILIYHQLNPYLQRLGGGEWYQTQIDEIISLFEEGDFENNKPLSGIYLMGFSLQRRALSKTKKEQEEIGDVE